MHVHQKKLNELIEATQQTKCLVVRSHSDIVPTTYLYYYTQRIPIYYQLSINYIQIYLRIHLYLFFFNLISYTYVY